MKKLLIWLSILLIIIPSLPYVPLQTADAAGGDSNIQTLSSPVLSTSVNANPYVAYTQLDNGDFRVRNDYTGDKTVGHTSNNRPIVNEMAQRLYMSDYPADHYYIDGYNLTHRYSHAQVSNRQVIGITPGRNTTQAYSEPPANTSIIAYSKTGGSDPYSSCAPYNSTGKLTCTYPYSFILHYKGDIEISKRITAKSDSTIGVGDTVKVTASVETKTGKTGSFAGAADVTTRTDQTTWSSDKKAVATVDANGKVTGVSKGTAKVCARWIKEDQPFGTWNIVDCVTITVSDGKGLTVNTPDSSCIKPGTTVTVKLNAKLTKVDGSTHDLSSGHTKLSFTSSNTAVATVISNGQVTLKGIGKTTITAKFVDSTQNLNESVSIEINVTDCSTTPSPPPVGGGGSCERVFQSTGVGSTQNATFLMPNPSGSISSDNGQFDVVKGIPSSEYLRADARSEEYLFEQKFQQQTGNVIFNNIKVTKTFTLKWKEESKEKPDKDGKKPEPKEMSEEETKEITVSGISRPYTYWEVTGYDIWKLSQARFTNYALPYGETILPSNVSVSAYATHVNDVKSHVFPAECVEIMLPPEEIDGGTSRPSIPDFANEGKAEAEGKIGNNQVENDSATFKSSTIMSNARTEVNGPTPSSIPSPSMVGMSASNLLIDPKKTNYFQSPSTGEVKYVPVFSLMNSAYDRLVPFTVNNVTVHTPVVIYSKASDDKEHDQRTNPPERSTPANPNTDRHAFILDRPFTVALPTSGQHRAIPGYGNRNYAKYIKEKQVKFPFDVYTETKAGFYPANTWISVPVDIETVKFFLPVWVPEKSYTVQFRSFAINALGSGDFGGQEKEANVTIPNTNWNVAPAGNQTAAHVATDSIEVDVVGRLYDFHVTDVADFNWLNTFRLGDKSTPTGKSYWVGTNGIDGDSRKLNSKYTLPLRHGSTEEEYSNVAVKTGYKFRFDLKTKGNMQDGNDAIRIKPTFYFVNKDGSNRRQVDLYYHNGSNHFVKVGSEQDKTYRQVVLNDTQRNIPETDLIANADYYYRHAENYDGMEELTKDYYATSFARKYLRSFSKDEQTTGPYGWQILNWKLRTFIGPEENEVPANTMVPAEDIVAAEQTWYSEYSIPANTYAVPQGTNLAKVGLNEQLSDNTPTFLRDGYIIVNFDVETINNGDVQNPRLQYINAPLVNQWFDMEGFARSFTDNYGNPFVSKDGDVVYYHTEKDAGSSKSDFDSSVSH